MVEVITFQQAIKQSPDRKKRKVLLGNGFSRACKDDIFSYEALYEQADFQNLSPSAREAFGALGTRDFEIVIRALRQTAQLAVVYVPDRPELVTTLIGDAKGLRDVLVETIARNHPARPQDIAADRYKACRKFLDNFECIYTLNYDLLLYWALMQDELPPMEFFEIEDGFRKPEEPNADYVAWDSGSSHTQSVYYMHGALHIFDAGSELKKYTWCNTQIALRRSVGATRGDIVLQFLLEATLVASAGGIAGAVIGWGGMQLATRMQKLPQILVWRPFATAILVSIVTGLVFGIYPAWKASRVDPIQALRS